MCPPSDHLRRRISHTVVTSPRYPLPSCAIFHDWNIKWKSLKLRCDCINLYARQTRSRRVISAQVRWTPCSRLGLGLLGKWRSRLPQLTWMTWLMFVIPTLLVNVFYCLSMLLVSSMQKASNSVKNTVVSSYVLVVHPVRAAQTDEALFDTLTWHPQCMIDVCKCLNFFAKTPQLLEEGKTSC